MPTRGDADVWLTGACWRTTALLAGGAFVLFVLLPQRTLHGVDGNVFVAWLEQGRLDYARHVAYLHLAALLYGALHPLGVGAFHVLLLASALGSALAVMCLHRAFVALTPLCVPTAVAPTIAALAIAPCFFYATCAEIHGVFVAGAAAAWWVFANWLLRPSRRVAVGLGVVCGAAASVHAYGHLLLPMFVAAALVLGRRKGHVGDGLTAVAAHVVTAVVIARLCGVGATAQFGDISRFCGAMAESFAPATMPAVAWREWLVPYAPWSIVALAALANRAARPFALVSVLGLLLHLPLTTLLLGAARTDEGGAYHLALVLPAIVASMLVLRPWAFWVCAAAGACLSVATAMPEWPEPVSPQFVHGVVELQEEHRFALVAARDELQGVRIAMPDAAVIDFGAALQVWAEQRAHGRALGDWFDRVATEFDSEGLPLAMSQRVLDWLEAAEDPEVRTFWHAYVPQHYLVVAVARGAFRGAWVVKNGTR